MTSISTHVLDTTAGVPAPDVPVRLEAADGDGWRVVAEGTTDGDGRHRFPASVDPGRHRVVFGTGAYLETRGRDVFYPRIAVEFNIAAGEPHYHIPLLLSTYGYSTYRGS